MGGGVINRGYYRDNKSVPTPEHRRNKPRKWGYATLGNARIGASMRGFVDPVFYRYEYRAFNWRGEYIGIWDAYDFVERGTPIPKGAEEVR